LFFMQDNVDTDPDTVSALHRSPRAVNLRVAQAESLGMTTSGMQAVQGSTAGGVGGSMSSPGGGDAVLGGSQTSNETYTPGGGEGGGSLELEQKLEELNNPVQ
jgi:hypothetical protein